MPIFDELLAPLEEVYDRAEDGAKYVITRYRDPGVNLRTPLQKIIKRAGLTHWPKLFQNIRATRATELAREHQGYVVASWCGHSEKIAQKHYWQVTDSDRSLWASWTGMGPRSRVYDSCETGWQHDFARIDDEYGPFDVTIMKCGASGDG